MGWLRSAVVIHRERQSTTGEAEIAWIRTCSANSWSSTPPGCRPGAGRRDVANHRAVVRGPAQGGGQGNLPAGNLARGAEHVDLAFSGHRAPRGRCRRQGDRPVALRRWHRQGAVTLPTCATVHNAVFAGTNEALERVRQLKPVERPELAAAFATLGDTGAELS